MTAYIKKPDNDDIQKQFLEDFKDPVISFFNSIKPDVDKFSDKQNRAFKLAVLNLIEKIENNECLSLN